MSSPSQRRLLILTTKLGYQTRAFVEAARKLNLDVCFGTDRCGRLEDPWGDHAVALKFEHPDDAAERVLDAKELRPIHAVVSLGDRPTPTAARIAQALGLPHHSPAAADACRDKYRSRQILRSAGLRVPRFVRLPLDGGERELLHAIARTGFPCVLKPLALSGSRGVIRANNPKQALSAWERVRKLLSSPEVRVLREDTSAFLQVESYVDGIEVAVEALVDRGELRILAIFDKPDPLVGPFFEETIYTTPSRLPAATQQVITATVGKAVHALGLTHGPVHAELRLDAAGAWPMEVAARSIGGLCSRALRFTQSGGFELCSLEEVILRLALGESTQDIARERAASGVMMIPIPEAGIYRDVEGVDGARVVAGIDEIRITAKPEERLLPLPEGASYLGFIFAHAQQPAQVEGALRQAHSHLRFRIGELLPVV